mgnify:CR=1 FL=1
MPELNRTPLLIVVSAPSGAGKTTLCRKLMAEDKSIVYSISCTTREPRSSEQDGKDYFFLSEEEFERRVQEGLFLEHATVHGNRYGTLKSVVEESLKKGKSVLMDIDVQGADQVRTASLKEGDGSLLKKAFMDIFISPPSLDVLKERLLCRGEDKQEVIERRMKKAGEEMKRSLEYRRRIVNDDLEKAYGELKAILKDERDARSGPSREKRKS